VSLGVVGHPAGAAGADLLASTESRGLQDRLLQASERAARTATVLELTDRTALGAVLHELPVASRMLRGA
jgi:hypothetical protein